MIILDNGGTENTSWRGGVAKKTKDFFFINRDCEWLDLIFSLAVLRA